jgi:hypothetical protein
MSKKHPQTSRRNVTPVQQSCEKLTHSFHFGYRDRHSDNMRGSGGAQSFRLHEPCPEGAGHWELPDYQVLDVPIRICGGLALRRHNPIPPKLSAETTLIKLYTLISSTEVTWWAIEPFGSAQHIVPCLSSILRASLRAPKEKNEDAFIVSLASLVHDDEENTNQPDCRFSMVSFTSLWAFTPRIHNTAVPSAIWALAPCPGARAFPHTTTSKRVYPR